MKKTFFALCLFIGLGAYAQVTDAEDDMLKKRADTIPDGWRLGGVFGANFSQVSLSNWSAGGQSSISINSLLNVFALYKKEKTTWDNYLDLGYGVIKQGNADMIKSDDRIEFTSKYGRRAAKNLYYAGLFNFRSQFAPGYNIPNDSVKISDFMAPGYFVGAVGMDYKPNDNLTLFLAPLTGKVTVVALQDLADQGAFGVEAAEYDTSGNKISDGKTVRTEFGGYLRLAYIKEIADNITFQTNLNMFSNYLENPQNIDVNWDNLISMKVNKYITANVSTSLIYDDDIDIQETKSDGTPKLDAEGNPEIGPRTQFKYVIAVGFQYKFGDKRN